jgi:SAM-dependent methyltransferase
LRKNDFDRIAPYYEFFKGIVFGHKLDLATEYFLDQVSAEDQVLILGGGHAKFLSEISDHKRIEYLDQSERMVGHIRKCYPEVKSIKMNFLDYENLKKFDVIISPFFLDVFSTKNLLRVIGKIRRLLKNDGILIVSEFYPAGSFKAVMLSKIMHIFFKLTTNLESKKLVDIPELLLNEGFILEKEEKWDNGFIIAHLYRKKETFMK